MYHQDVREAEQLKAERSKGCDGKIVEKSALVRREERGCMNNSRGQLLGEEVPLFRTPE